MDLLTLILVIVVVGFVLWLIEKYVPMDATVKHVGMALIVIFLVIWFLQRTGLLGGLNIRI